MFVDKAVRDPRIREFSVILSPYSNRGERIGARISVYEEREREMIKYTCDTNKEKRQKSVSSKENLRPEQRVLSPSHVLNY
jgi:hypothetical protein